MEITQAFKEKVKGDKKYPIAYALGISVVTFIRWMKNPIEFTRDDRVEILEKELGLKKKEMFEKGKAKKHLEKFTN